MSNTTVGLILALIGVLTMVGAALNWRIVTHPGKLLNIIFGDRIARIIAFLVGLFIFTLAITEILGLNWIGD
jgi:hypothetical protein